MKSLLVGFQQTTQFDSQPAISVLSYATNLSLKVGLSETVFEQPVEILVAFERLIEEGLRSE